MVASTERVVKFADFRAGDVIEAGPYEVTEADIVAFARAYDPQWFHTSPEAAAQGRFGGLIASGWHTCAMAMRLATEAVLQGSESCASPGVERIEWSHPVRPGDRLRLRATLLDVRRSQSRPMLGILRWRWQLANQDGVGVLDLQVTSLFDLDGAPPVAVEPASTMTTS
jgi:acyl dehydratase